MFDAAAEFQKTSLNKNLLKGSDYLSSLVGILLRFFHRDKFAVMTHIEQMYHHVSRRMWPRCFKIHVEKYA